ncbi:MAG: VCBS repeat-containing protein [Fidelibacterota bacterium]
MTHGPNTTPILLGFFLVFYSCQQEPSQPLFKKLTPRQTHITFENALEEDSLFNMVNYLYFYDGGGVAVGDVNNDGLSDIYFTANMLPNRLYLNKGEFQFEDVTETAGVQGNPGEWTTGTTMADVNGDGLLDIYVCVVNYLNRKGINHLFINNGDLTFTDRAAEFGLDHKGLSRQAAFFDADLDGDLDMYLLNHSVHSKQTFGDTSLRKIRDYEVGDKFYRQDDGRFTDVTLEAGIYESILGYGLGVAVGDINWDGYPDIYISNDFHENDYLYYNNKDGTFTEQLTRSTGHVSSASMGNDLADFNNDGLLDIVVVDMFPEKETVRKSSVSADSYDIYDTKIRYGYTHQVRRNTLQLNRGPGGQIRASSSPTSVHLFSEIGQLAGVHATDWSWASLFVDLDNDGYKDLFVTNGIFRRPNDLDFLTYIKRSDVQVRLGARRPGALPTVIERDLLDELLKRMPTVAEANYAFHSQGDLTFINRAGEWGLGDPGFSSGAAFADFDNDGAMDLVVNNVNAPSAVYRNLLYSGPGESRRGGNYLKVTLKGGGKNTFGTGTKITLYHADRMFFQEQMPTRGFQSSVEPVLNFGLGDIDRIDSLEVIWPTGETQVLKNLAVNRTVELKWTDAKPDHPSRFQDYEEPLFREVTDEVSLDYTHQENTFIEYNREPLIPHFLSTAGPALAVADVNGDGLKDLFLGGAKHQPGVLFYQEGPGRFHKEIDSLFIRESRGEDVDATFFDANGDGFVDLYVVRGGNEFWGKMGPLRDRLYMNDGRGQLRRAKDALPEIHANGACVEPVDVDNDGDVDLFVGSRSVPWNYGVIPQSYLLINDGEGKFTDETSIHAPELSRVGMVTDAVWVDLNNDSYHDLVVVGEWMPVTVFHNENGRLVNVTDRYELQNTTGWWNAVAEADLNDDGYPDLVIGNLGLNSVLKASGDRPVQMFLGHFSEDDRLDQILAYYNGDEVYPLASRDQMILAVPFLEKKYPTYRDYAGEPVKDILPREELRSATVRRATQFASILLLNKGDTGSGEAGGFRTEELPVEAQFSPVHAILIDDFNTDGHSDILLGGNFYNVPPDQGRYDASYGCLLLGDGKGSFHPAPLQESGFVVTGQVRHMKSFRSGSGETLIVVARNDDSAVVFRQTARSKNREIAHTQ